MHSRQGLSPRYAVSSLFICVDVVRSDTVPTTVKSTAADYICMPSTSTLFNNATNASLKPLELLISRASEGTLLLFKFFRLIPIHKFTSKCSFRNIDHRERPFHQYGCCVTQHESYTAWNGTDEIFISEGAAHDTSQGLCHAGSGMNSRIYPWLSVAHLFVQCPLSTLSKLSDWSAQRIC